MLERQTHHSTKTVSLNMSLSHLSIEDHKTILKQDKMQEGLLKPKKAMHPFFLKSNFSETEQILGQQKVNVISDYSKKYFEALKNNFHHLLGGKTAQIRSKKRD